MIVDVEQGTAEWIQLRVGLVTASRAADVLAKLKTKDKESAARANYRSEIVCETLTGRAADHFVSPAMEWGTLTEPMARTEYELKYDVNVDLIGFATHPSIKRFGASPDGLVGENGLVEFKCPNTSTHIGWFLEGKVPEEYQPQMLAEMACTGRQWCDFVSFDPRLPKKLRMYTVRFVRDEERIKALELEVNKFLSDVDFTIAQLDKLANGMNLGLDQTQA